MTMTRESTTAPDDATRERMRRQRTTGTANETAVSGLLRLLGIGGYRVDWPLPLDGRRRRADLAWPARRVAWFSDGCFWHACPDHGRAPRKDAGWWTAKLARNAARDRDTTGALEATGWTVIRSWEHEHPEESVRKLVDALTRARYSDYRHRNQGGTTE